MSDLSEGRRNLISTRRTDQTCIVDDSLEVDADLQARRRRRWFPKMIIELIGRPTEGHQDPVWNGRLIRRSSVTSSETATVIPLALESEFSEAALGSVLWEASVRQARLAPASGQLGRKSFASSLFPLRR